MQSLNLWGLMIGDDIMTNGSRRGKSNLPLNKVTFHMHRQGGELQFFR